MRAIFINGSPRKNKNTAQMLESAMKGAPEMPKHEVQVYVLVADGQAPVFTKVIR